jgi:hypothetical protein
MSWLRHAGFDNSGGPSAAGRFSEPSRDAGHRQTSRDVVSGESRHGDSEAASTISTGAAGKANHQPVQVVYLR